MAAVEQEILQFLSKDAAEVTKLPAVTYVLGLTATEDGLQFLRENKHLLDAVASLLDDRNLDVVSKSYDCLLNVTSDSTLAAYFLERDRLLKSFLSSLSGSNNRAKAASILSNLTQSEEGARKLWTLMVKDTNADQLLKMFVQRGSEFDRLGFIFANLTQLGEVRSWFMDRETCRIKQLFPFLTTSTWSTVRRHGVASVLRNCCFDTHQHDWLLSSDVDILPRLLFPLLGPEELDEDEMENLPLDLQYLGSEKQREEDWEIRKMLLEALTQLCATKSGREALRNNGTYYVARELHKTEACRAVVVACEDLVDILIGDEPGPGMENLREVEVPPHLVEKFNRMNEELLKE